MTKRFRLLVLALVPGMLAVACATTEFNIPAVTGGSDGNSLPGKVVWHELLTDTPAQTRAFYGELFGWEFKPLSGGQVNYELISHRGVAIGGMIDQNRLPNKVDISQWVPLLAVADVDDAARIVGATGGEVLTPPTSLGERGRISVITDSQGALLALLETGGDPLDDDAEPVAGRFLWDELWTVDVDGAVNFYRGLAPYELDETDSGGALSVETRVLATLGVPRASVRSRPIEELRPRWINYLMVEDEAQLRDILSRVDSLGGEVLVAATERPNGGHVALVTGPSGAGIALQTWSPDQDGTEQQEGQL